MSMVTFLAYYSFIKQKHQIFNNYVTTIAHLVGHS